MARTRTIDLVRLVALTRDGMPAKLIGPLIGCSDDTVRNHQRRLGLRADKRHVKFANKCWAEPAIGYDAADVRQWREREPWPVGLVFTDAALRPMLHPTPPPRTGQTASYCSNSSALMEAC